MPLSEFLKYETNSGDIIFFKLHDYITGCTYIDHNGRYKQTFSKEFLSRKVVGKTWHRVEITVNNLDIHRVVNVTLG